jgi:hypothetical protein
VLVSRIDRLLARTDPFDLAQAVERYVSSLSGTQVRTLLRATGPRLGSYYRDELARLAGARDFSTALEQSSDAHLHTALVQFLKSNLRAIPFFGTAFGLAVLKHAPVDRAVAIGEEHPNRGLRIAIIAGAALALVAAGAAGERVAVGARAAQTPPPLILAEPVAAPTAPPLHDERTPMKHAVARVEVKPSATPPETAAPSAPPSAAPAPTPSTGPAPTPSPERRLAVGPPPSGQGQAVVTVAPETPSPEPSDIDVEDMPESYSDATPLPQQSPATAQPQLHAIRVPTPKPSPKHHSWLHRTLMHLDPFKPNP